MLRELLQAHEYWGIKRLSVDLVIFNERGASYVQDLQVALESMVRVAQGRLANRRRRYARPGIRAARGSHHLRNSWRPVCGGARGPVRQAWQSRRPGRTHAADADAGATRAASSDARIAAGEHRDGEVRAAWNSSTGSAVSRRRVANTPLRPRSPRRRHGSMSSPIATSAFMYRPRAAASPGRATVAKTRSRPGATTRSRIDLAR